MNIRYIKRIYEGGVWLRFVKYTFEISCNDNEDIEKYNKELFLNSRYQLGAFRQE